MKLFNTFKKGNLTLKNRVVMAPMTRSRSTADHIPTEIMTTYYQQRSGAGLIITEGTSPSPNGSGYPRIPGIYNEAQIVEWKKITDAVHENDSKIFIQLMHTGRVSHPANMDGAASILSASAIAPSTTKMYVDGEGEMEIPTPKEMTEVEIESTIEEYVTAAKNAIKAGFDGVEIHGANGYLIDQFINTGSNHRSDKWGGSVENRCRFALEITRRTIEAIGSDKVGIRFSPNGAMNDVGPFDEQTETFNYLAKEMDDLGILYVHLVNHGPMGAPALPIEIRDYFRAHFSGILILSGGYDKESAEADINSYLGDLVAFGRPFIANPDLVERMKNDQKLSDPNFDTFYTPGAEGYIDYPIA